MSSERPEGVGWSQANGDAQWLELKKTDEGDGSAMIRGGSCYEEVEDDGARPLGILAGLGDDAGCENVDGAAIVVSGAGSRSRR